MFKSIQQRKELIDKELELYRNNKLLDIDIEVENYRSKTQKMVHDLAVKCKNQLADYEHEFHHAKEVKGIELARLDSKIEALRETVKAREEVIAADNNLLKAKMTEIDRLNEIIKLMISKMPNVQQLVK